MTSAEPVVRADGLVVRRGGSVVLDDLTFAVTAGQVTVLGLPAGHPRLRARVGYSTQQPAVYPDLTLGENLRYFGTVLGLRRDKLTAAIARTVDELDLGGLQTRLVGTFSGGQLARVGLAVALLASPDLLAGYAIAFGLLACVQVAVVLIISLTWLGVSLPGSAVPMAVVAVLDAILGMSLGLFASAFARSEFQAVQFMPAFVLPQALLCGLVVARADMTPALRWLSDVLPLSYAVDAMQRIGVSASWTTAIGADIAVIAAFIAAALVGGALTLRRRTR